MSRFMRELKHAFAVEKRGDIQPTEQQQAVIDRLCREVVRRRMVTPTLLFLEMSRPLNYVSAQVMHFFQPILAIVADTQGYQRFASFLERRGSIEYLCRRLEQLEQERAGDATRQPDHNDNDNSGSKSGISDL